jgi:hypothetical protein
MPSSTPSPLLLPITTTAINGPTSRPVDTLLSRHHASRGVIAGGVVGALGALGLALVIALALRTRRWCSLCTNHLESGHALYTEH